MYICIMHIGYVHYPIFLGCVISGQNTQKGYKKEYLFKSDNTKQRPIFCRFAFLKQNDNNNNK